MRALRRSSQFICLSAIALDASLCLAQTQTPVQLTWDAPKNCPQEAEVQQQLRAILGESVNEPTNPFVARGSIEPVAGHYRLSLLIERRNTHGSRVIESDDCTSLAKAATVVLGLLVQREKTLGRELSESEISGQPEPSRPPEPQASAKPPDAPKATTAPVVPEPTKPLHWLLRAPQGRLDFSTLPTGTYGVGLGVGMHYYSWRALLSGTYYPVEHATESEGSSYRIEFGRKTIEALGCYGWRFGYFEASPCAMLEANRVSAHAGGERLATTDKTAFWLSFGAGVSAFLHLHRNVALVAMTNGRLTLNRARFLVSNPMGPAPAHQVPLVTFDASLACELSF